MISFYRKDRKWVKKNSAVFFSFFSFGFYLSSFELGSLLCLKGLGCTQNTSVVKAVSQSCCDTVCQKQGFGLWSHYISLWQLKSIDFTWCTSPCLFCLSWIVTQCTRVEFLCGIYWYSLSFADLWHSHCNLDGITCDRLHWTKAELYINMPFIFSIILALGSILPLSACATSREDSLSFKKSNQRTTCFAIFS